MNDKRLSFAAIACAALLLVAVACSSSSTTTSQATNDYGNVSADAASTASTQPVIPGPAKVDSSGNVYTSSATGGGGNAASVGTNTNVMVKPSQAPATTNISSSAIDTTVAPDYTTNTVETESQATALAPVVPRDTPTADVPMMSSATEQTDQTTTNTTETTTTTTTTTHKRMRKD